MDSQEPEDSQGYRKTPIDGLSKDELVKKYRQAILIAQKAKESKAEFLKHISEQEDHLKSLEDRLKKSEDEKKQESNLRAKIEAQLEDARLLIVNMKHPTTSSNIREEEYTNQNCESELASELEESKNTIKIKEAELLQLQNAYKSICDINEELEKRASEKGSEIETLHRNIAQDKMAFENCQAELRLKIKSLEKTVENEKSSLKGRDLDLLSRHEDMERQHKNITEMKHKLEQFQKGLCDKTEENEKLLCDIENKDQEITKLSSEISEIRNEVARSKVSLSEYTAKVNELQSEENSSSEKISCLETENANLSKHVKELKKRICDLDNGLKKIEVNKDEDRDSTCGNNQNEVCANCQSCTTVMTKDLNDELATFRSREREHDEIVSNLNAELAKLREDMILKDKSIQFNDENVALLKSEIEDAARLTKECIASRDDSAGKIDVLQAEIEKLAQSNLTLESVKVELEILLNENSSEIKKLQESALNLEGEAKYLRGQLSEKEILLQNSEETVKELLSQIQKLNNELQEQTSEQVLTALSEENVKLQKEICLKQEGICEISSELTDVKKYLKLLENQKGELQNQLKDAGEKLLQQEKDIHQYETNCTAAAKLQQELRDQLSSLQDAFRAKDLLVHELENELAKLRDLVANESTNTEVSSTFSLSRAEELNRMKDLEDSFEDKYTKLRVVAVKLKRRVTELTQTLESERSRNVAEKSDLQTKLTQLAAHVKTVQTLQSEVDCLQDSLEDGKMRERQLTKDLEAAVKEASEKKFQLASLQEELQRLLNEKKSLEASISNLESAHSQTDALQIEVEKLCKQLEEKEALLDTCKKEKMKLSEQLEKLCADAKKKSVLSLEMADMEKSVEELTRQLEAKEEQLRKTKSELEEKHSSSLTLQNELKNLEVKRREKEESCKELKDALTVSKEEVCKLLSKCENKESAITQLSSQLEKERSLVEELNIQYSDLAAKHVQSTESARVQAEMLNRQVFQLEEQCSQMRGSHKALEDDLANVRTEFESYKVRAQSVLRQSTKQEERGVSSSTVHNAEELEVEVERLRVSVTTLKASLQQATSQLQAASQEVSLEREEKLRAIKQAQNFKDSCMQAVERQRTSEERLSVVLEESKQAKLHSDTLLQCYKQQMEDIKIAHQKKIASMNEQLETLQTSITNPSAAPVESNRPSSVQGGRSPVAEWANHLPNATSSDPDLTMREQGEGSESVDSFPSRRISVTSQDRRHELVPLDKLLSSPTYPEDDARDVCRPNSSDLSVDLLQSKLSACESRASHLTALLSEAESDAARLSQLNDVLKEEIRRHQRCEERAQHAHNLEYLKNVVVKFITLQNGGERQRLVPVLNTILKLSPEEAGLIETAAKGTAQTNTGSGWGSYLPLPSWTGS